MISKTSFRRLSLGPAYPRGLPDWPGAQGIDYYTVLMEFFSWQCLAPKNCKDKRSGFSSNYLFYSFATLSKVPLPFYLFLSNSIFRYPAGLIAE